ncbi:GNAT family N-acetyltransferase [Myxosarcina sp. GI1]|uniref:GNAT family N-acetyltransferase n=1 Tax=Myxosarcina sp. GI1 TaxID=1541065 RepID=UPI00055CEAEA|nr:GNAT family N-acetyltransferase [Myxosarcina sp. GI1]
MSDRSLRFKIRPLNTKDSNEVFLLKQQATYVLNSPDYTPEQIAALCRPSWEKFNLENLKITDSVALFVANSTASNKYANNFISIVGESEDKIIGYGFLQVDNLSWVNNGTLFELFVHPDYARRSVGTKLLQHLEVYAREHDCKVIFVGASLTALPFYKSCNYQIIEYGSYERDRVKIPVVFMEKCLVELTEMERVYWRATEEFNRNAGWLFDETAGLLRQTSG